MGTHLDEAVAGYYVPPWACSPAHRKLRVFYRLSLLLLLNVVIYVAHMSRLSLRGRLQRGKWVHGRNTVQGMLHTVAPNCRQIDDWCYLLYTLMSNVSLCESQPYYQVWAVSVMCCWENTSKHKIKCNTAILIDWTIVLWSVWKDGHSILSIGKTSYYQLLSVVVCISTCLINYCIT